MDKMLFLAQYLKTKYRRFADREALAQWQERKVRRFLRRVVPQAPFYRQRFAGLPLQSWRTWPTLDKALLMAHFSACNTVGVTKEEAFSVAYAAEVSRDFKPTVRGVTVGLSSGTSGGRGLFLASAAERAKWAGAVLAKALPGTLLRAQRIAFFLRADSNLYQTLGSRRIQFRFFDLLQPIAAHVVRLNVFQPTILVAPPSLLRLLADLLGAELRIAPVKIIAVAEVLEPLDRAYLEARFQRCMHQIYQCTEGFLGVTCEKGVLHLNEDLIAIQKDQVDGCRFRPILTDFNRIAQPIIRYRLDDILIERNEPCACGSPYLAIAQIEGRADDVFYLPAARQTWRWVPVFPDFIRRAIIAAGEGVREYTAVQVDADRIEIGLRCQSDACIKSRILENLAALWRVLGTVTPDVVFGDVAPLPPGKKRRRVQRRFQIQ